MGEKGSIAVSPERTTATPTWGCPFPKLEGAGDLPCEGDAHSPSNIAMKIPLSPHMPGISRVSHVLGLKGRTGYAQVPPRSLGTLDLNSLFLSQFGPVP